jgi:hypothetical protein
MPSNNNNVTNCAGSLEILAKTRIMIESRTIIPLQITTKAKAAVLLLPVFMK